MNDELRTVFNSSFIILLASPCASPTPAAGARRRASGRRSRRAPHVHGRGRPAVLARDAHAAEARHRVARRVVAPDALGARAPTRREVAVDDLLRLAVG